MMLFFDLDGTLLDSNGVWLKVDDEFLSRRGLAATPEYTFTVGHSIFPVAAQYTKDYYHLDDTPQEIMAEWRALAYDAYAHTVPLKPGAAALLKRLKIRGDRMALLTASLPELCQAALKRHGLESFFEELFFSQEVGMEKRDPQVYILAARRFGVDPKDCVLFEDAPYNCAAAKEAGYTVVGVYDDLYASRWDDVVANSHYAVRSLEEFLKQ